MGGKRAWLWAKWPRAAEEAGKEGFPEEVLGGRVLGNGQGKEKRQEHSPV